MASTSAVSWPILSFWALMMRVWFSISCLIWSSEDSTPEDEGATEAAVGVGVDEGGFARTGEAVLMGAGAAAGVGLDSERMGMDERGCGREIRSEEHTSELQSQSNLVCRLLLEKKKKH